MDFAEAIDSSELEEFGFTDDFIIELWGVITDARSGRLKWIQGALEVCQCEVGVHVLNTTVCRLKLHVRRTVWYYDHSLFENEDVTMLNEEFLIWDTKYFRNLL